MEEKPPFIKYDVTESKSGHLLALANGIIPLNLPQKAEKIGQQIQYRLSNPPGAHLIVYQVRSLERRS